MNKATWISLLLSIIMVLIPLAGLATEAVSCSTDPIPTELVRVIFQGPPRLRPSVKTDDDRTIEVHPQISSWYFSCFDIVPHPETGRLPETAFFEGEAFTTMVTTNQEQLPKLYIVTFEFGFTAQKLVLETTTPEGEIYRETTTGEHGANLRVAYSVFGDLVHLTAFDEKYSQTEPVFEVLDFDTTPLDIVFTEGGGYQLTVKHRFTGDEVTLTIKSIWDIFYASEGVNFLEAFELGILKDLGYTGNFGE